MTTEILVREEVGFDEVLNEGLVSLANRAKEAFGYEKLADAHSGNAAELEKAMIELNIRPFSKSTVDAYKNKMVEANSSKDLLASLVSVAMWLLCGTLASLCVCIIGFIGGFIFTHQLVGLTGYFGTGLCLSFVMLIASVCAVGFTSENGKVRTAKWQSLPLNERYSHILPEFALETAVSLKEKCPTADFFIEHLNVEERIVDPFLYVCDSVGGIHYLEVWLEPDFKAKKVV